LVLSFEKYTFQKLKINDFGFLGGILTFAIVVVAWVFFRSPDISTSLYIISKFFSFDYGMPFIGDSNVLTNSVLMLFVGIVFDSYLFKSDINLEILGSRIRTGVLVGLLCFFTLLVVLFFSNTTNFIYFQF
jgi:hypothetical protein